MNAPRPAIAPFERIAVVGCGLIGGSFALASRALPQVRHVVVTDADRTVRERARQRGVGDRVGEDLAATVRDADLVVLAVPVPAIPRLIQELSGCISNRPVLTDVASVKSWLTPSIRQDLGHIGPFIGGHPMAGSERSGIDAADGSLFQGATWLLTPTDDVEAEVFERLAAHLRAIGTRVLAVDPARHDRLVAAASHLPQVLASTLMAHAARRAEEERGLFAVAAGGFRDVTRVAGSDPNLWRGILEANAPAVVAELDGYLDALGQMRDAIADGRWHDVTRRLETARDARRALPGKEVDGALHDLVVGLPDSPGTLAAVTTALGESGINIEDLSMRHADDGTRGALVIAIAGDERAQQARDELRTRGFACHLEPR